MKLKTLIAAAALTLASAASHAGVIYEWNVIDNKGIPLGFKPRIELENGAVQKGTFKVRLEPGKAPMGDAGLISLTMGSVKHVAGANPFAHDIGYIDLNLSFVENNYFLTGSVSVSNFSDRFNASTFYGSELDPRVFTIFNTDGDSMLICAMQPSGVCEGITGVFRQVPEPTSVALLGLGLAGGLAARRRKRKQ